MPGVAALAKREVSPQPSPKIIPRRLKILPNELEEFLLHIWEGTQKKPLPPCSLLIVEMVRDALWSKEKSTFWTKLRILPVKGKNSHENSTRSHPNPL